MKHYPLFGGFGILTFAIVLLGSSRTVAVERADDHAAHFEACAKACTDCLRECEMCARYCAGMISMGHKDHLATLANCADCAEFCTAAAKITSRGGPLAAEICESCAKACDKCAEACEKHPNDEHMKRCAKECRACATACREMIKHAAQR